MPHLTGNRSTSNKPRRSNGQWDAVVLKADCRRSVPFPDSACSRSGYRHYPMPNGCALVYKRWPSRFRRSATRLLKSKKAPTASTTLSIAARYVGGGTLIAQSVRGRVRCSARGCTGFTKNAFQLWKRTAAHGATGHVCSKLAKRRLMTETDSKQFREE